MNSSVCPTACCLSVGSLTLSERDRVAVWWSFTSLMLISLCSFLTINLEIPEMFYKPEKLN